MPIAWYPTKATPSSTLAVIFWELVLECESRGLPVHAVIADGLSTNQQFFKLVSQAGAINFDCPLVAPNPVAQCWIYLCSDPLHLLKVSLA